MGGRSEPVWRRRDGRPPAEGRVGWQYTLSFFRQEQCRSREPVVAMVEGKRGGSILAILFSINLISRGAVLREFEMYFSLHALGVSDGKL